MPSKYATTSSVRCDENVHYDITMCVIAREGVSSLIALLYFEDGDKTNPTTLSCHIDRFVYSTTPLRGPFKCYVTLFFCKLGPHPPPRNANNIEHYTFVMLFPENRTPPPPTKPPPSALRNTWMAPYTTTLRIRLVWSYKGMVSREGFI